MSQADVFKVALLVDDLEGAMRDLGAWLSVAWTPVQESPLVLERDGGRESLTLRYAYSTGGPVYIELLESQPEGYYATPDGPHLHHVGRWVDDLPKACAELEAQGLALEAAGVNEAGESPALFAFHRGAHGLRVELVDRANQASFEAWLAGGTLELG